MRSWRTTKTRSDDDANAADALLDVLVGDGADARA